MPYFQWVMGDGMGVNCHPRKGRRPFAVTGCRDRSLSFFCAMIALVSHSLWAEPAAETLKVVRTIPHSGYSEGLDFFEKFLWQAQPSVIRKIDPASGEVVKEFQPPTEYSESLAWFQGGLWNLSFKDNGIYFGKLDASGALRFTRRGSTKEIHGWGLTQNGKDLLFTGSYGSRKIYTFDPSSGQITREITAELSDLEDLAWDGQGIWTSTFNVRQTYKGKPAPLRGTVFRLDPANGSVQGFYALPDPEQCPVIDGIASLGTRLWITGKNCTSIWLVENPKKGKREVSTAPRQQP